MTALAHRGQQSIRLLLDWDIACFTFLKVNPFFSTGLPHQVVSFSLTMQGNLLMV